LARLDFTSLGTGAEATRRRAESAAGDYLAPRLDSGSDVIVVALVGPSGGGKSTIMNTLARRALSEAGPVRPTTIEPVAWTGHSLPATLDGLRRRMAGSMVDSLRPPPDGVVLIDSPPPEVIGDAGIPVVTGILEVADAVVFVTGGSRYADNDAFELLELAAARRLPTVMVLNRLPKDEEIQAAVTVDFAEKLAARRLIPRADAELITIIPETDSLTEHGGIDPLLVAGVAKDVEAMADPQSRPDIVDAVVNGTVRRLRHDLHRLRGLIIDGAVRRVELLDPVRSIYRLQSRGLVGDVRTGKFASLKPETFIDAVASAAARRAGSAARIAAEEWSEHAPDLVDGTPGLFGHGHGLVDVARDRLEFWMSDLDDLAERMSGKRPSKRWRRRLGSALRASVADPRHRPERRTRARLDRVPGIVEAARDGFATEVDGILMSDSIRFVERLGRAVPSGVLAELTEELL
jgi:hypothetical protein